MKQSKSLSKQSKKPELIERRRRRAEFKNQREREFLNFLSLLSGQPIKLTREEHESLAEILDGGQVSIDICEGPACPHCRDLECDPSSAPGGDLLH